MPLNVSTILKKQYRFASQAAKDRKTVKTIGGSAEVATKDNREAPDRPHSTIFHSEFSEDAKRLGIDVPIDVKEASKFKYILMCEERQKKMFIEREVLMGTRVHVAVVDKLLNAIIQSILKELPSVRSIFEDMPEIDESTKRVLRDKAREWTDRFRDAISSQEIDEASLTPENGLVLRNIQGEKVKGSSQERGTETEELRQVDEDGPEGDGV